MGAGAFDETTTAAVSPVAQAVNVEISDTIFAQAFPSYNALFTNGTSNLVNRQIDR